MECDLCYTDVKDWKKVYHDGCYAEYTRRWQSGLCAYCGVGEIIKARVCADCVKLGDDVKYIGYEKFNKV